MGSNKPKPQRAPFEENRTQTNTFGTYSIANTPEAQSFLNTPLDFGSPVNVDPGIQRRTDLRKQGVENRYGSAINFGVPAFIRDMNKARELRDIDSQGNAEMQQAEYANQVANNEMTARQTMADLERKRLLLPQILQLGGSGTSSGYNTQVVQPQPGFLANLGSGLGSGIGSALAGPFGKI